MKPQPVYEVQKTPDGFTIHRNGQPLKTPAELTLKLPTEPLAQAIAEEWRAQGEKPKPQTMPFTQLAMTALDIIAKKREDIVSSLAAYAENDLLCHHADEPPDLAAHHAKTWQPWLDWAAKTYLPDSSSKGQGILHIARGIMPIAQPRESLNALRHAIDTYGIFQLAGLQQAVSLTGSLILGLALIERKATSTDLFTAAELDALYQVEKWGEDPVTTERHNSLRNELQQCEAWFKLLA